MSHPRHQLDDLLGHPVRFSIVALLAAADRAEFAFVRDQVEVNDQMLSKQMTLLEDAGHVKVHKGYVDNRARTWLSLTRGGRRTFDRHMAALREIAEARSVATRSFRERVGREPADSLPLAIGSDVAVKHELPRVRP